MFTFVARSSSLFPAKSQLMAHEAAPEELLLEEEAVAEAVKELEEEDEEEEEGMEEQGERQK